MRARGQKISTRGFLGYAGGLPKAHHRTESAYGFRRKGHRPLVVQR
jgi:hypothetical protein